MGLGLAIVKEVINGHHGQIRAESAGSGCVFRIGLPLATRATGKDLSSAAIHG